MVTAALEQPADICTRARSASSQVTPEQGVPSLPVIRHEWQLKKQKQTAIQGASTFSSPKTRITTRLIHAFQP